MSGKRFTNEQHILLWKNPYVTKVTEKSITYSEDFKIHAINEYAKGKTPTLIFIEAKLDPQIIGSKTPKCSLSRWSSVYFKEGTSGLMGEKRGRRSSGRPQTSDMSVDIKKDDSECIPESPFKCCIASFYHSTLQGTFSFFIASIGSNSNIIHSFHIFHLLIYFA